MTDWTKQALEDMLTVIAEVMPHPDAEKVIAVCLTKAGLETFAQGLELKEITLQVLRDPDEPWDASIIYVIVNGTKIKIEVSVDG